MGIPSERGSCLSLSVEPPPGGGGGAAPYMAGAAIAVAMTSSCPVITERKDALAEETDIPDNPLPIEEVNCPVEEENTSRTAPVDEPRDEPYTDVPETADAEITPALPESKASLLRDEYEDDW